MMFTMYEVHELSVLLNIPGKEVLLCMFDQGFELSEVACFLANKILFNL